MPRLLIVDDCAPIRSIIEHVARGENFETATAADGVAALRMMPEFAPHVVTLDINMPGMDGRECLRAIKANWPNVRVLMISGVEESSNRKACLALGASEYLAKPFGSRELRTCLRRLAAPRADRVPHLTSPQPDPAEADARRLPHPSVVPDRRASAALISRIR